MRAGKRNKRIVIQSNTPTRGDDGSEVEAWSTFKTVWAELVPVRGGERFDTDQRSASQDVEFRILHLAGVTPKMRISYGGNFYNIRDVSEIGTREGVKLTCDAIEVQS